MKTNYAKYFRTASAVEKVALHAGLAPARARAISEKLAAGLPAAQRQRLFDRIGMTDAKARLLLALMEEKNLRLLAEKNARLLAEKKNKMTFHPRILSDGRVCCSDPHLLCDACTNRTQHGG